jgi:APA family basic amino acid/polyamine antiporter
MDGSQAPAFDSVTDAPRPVLHARAAFAIAVGIVVGAGIFRTPSLVAGAAASEAVFLGAWLVGGLLSIVGALCYSELASTYPQAGGDYNYLKRAFGARVAFLYAWARLAVIQTGSIALLAYVAGDYLAQLLDFGAWSAPAYAASAVIALTAINWIGVRQGTATQNWLTAVEIGGLVAIILAGLLFTPETPRIASSGADGNAYGLILVFVLLTYGGWSEAVYVTAEVRNASRVMPRILILSLTAIAALYLLANLAYLRVLGLGGIAASDTVAAAAMQAVFGAPGAAAISALVVAAALTSANATLITGARSAYAAGRDFPALAPLGRWDAGSGSPRTAVLAQGVLALLLVALGAFARDGFRTAVEYTAPVFWLFFLLVGISLFVLRRRDPHAPRAFRVPLYPLLPLLFCATSAYLLYSSLAYTGIGALVGVAVLAVGGVLLLRLRCDPSPQEPTS